MRRGHSVQEVAAWMLEKLRRDGMMMYQQVVAHEVMENFGEEFTYYNKNGNLALRRDVLDAFSKLSGKDVVWSRAGRYWRKREASDLPGRQQP